MIFGMHGCNNGKNPFQSQEILVRNVRVLFYGELGYRDADGVRFILYGNWIRKSKGNDVIIENNQILFSPYAFVGISNNRAICGGEYQNATCLQVRIFIFTRCAEWGMQDHTAIVSLLALLSHFRLLWNWQKVKRLEDIKLKSLNFIRRFPSVSLHIKAALTDHLLSAVLLRGASFGGFYDYKTSSND